MAKTALAHRPQIVVALPPRRGRVRRAARRAGAVVVRAARRAAPHAKRSLPTVGVTLGAAVVGWLDAKGYLDKLPQIGGSKTITLMLAGYAATRFIKNRHVRDAGLAALAAGAFDFGRVQGGGTSGFADVADAGGGPHSGQGY